MNYPPEGRGLLARIVKKKNITMTLEEYKKLPFKTDGNGEEILIGDIWGDLNREKRRLIQKELKRDKMPRIENII